MKSVNHQFLEFSDQVVKRYTKSRLYPITGWRLNPRNAVNPNERLEFLLATPENNVEFTPYDQEGNGEPTKVKQVAFTYEDEVLELYTEMEVRSFERMNRLLIENGFLVEYDSTSPAVNKVNTLSDVELRKIAKLKMLTTFKQRIKELTSIYTLEGLLEIMDSIDTVTIAQVKAVKERINEIKQRED
jgi:hypothetical protein